mgnify:CR=1 FL=1
MPFCRGGVGVGKGNPENAFFILVGGDGTHRPHPGLRPYSPRGPQRARTDCTSQAAEQTTPKPGRANTRADHARHDTHAQTLDTLHRSALDTRQAAAGTI